MRFTHGDFYTTEKIYKKKKECKKQQSIFKGLGCLFLYFLCLFLSCESKNFHSLSDHIRNFHFGHIVFALEL